MVSTRYVVHDVVPIWFLWAMLSLIPMVSMRHVVPIWFHWGMSSLCHCWHCALPPGARYADPRLRCRVLANSTHTQSVNLNIAGVEFPFGTLVSYYKKKVTVFTMMQNWAWARVMILFWTKDSFHIRKVDLSNTLLLVSCAAGAPYAAGWFAQVALMFVGTQDQTKKTSECYCGGAAL